MSVFLGWLPDAPTQDALGALQRRIQSQLPMDAPRHDWRKPTQGHITLRYLGEQIDAQQRIRIDAALQALSTDTTAPFANLDGAQYWPHARVLVARIAASDALKALLKQLEAVAQACGFAKERLQTAHVTLAYLPRDSTPTTLAESANGIAVPLQIGRIHLLSSKAGGYASSASWPLADPSACS